MYFNVKQFFFTKIINILNTLIDLCVDLYDPDTNNYEIPIEKFYIEYSNSFDYKKLRVDKNIKKM